MGDADAGLLVVNGIGSHDRTTILKAVLDPLLDRLAVEQQLADVRYDRIGEAGSPDAYDCLEVDYTTEPIADPNAPAGVRTLFVMEGNWSGVYAKSSAERMSSWIGRRSARMVLQLIVYLARTWLWAPAFVSLALLLFAMLSPILATGGWPLGPLRVRQEYLAMEAVAASLLVALAAAFAADLPDLWRSTPRGRKWWIVPAAASTLLVYQIQRGIVLVIAALALVLLPAGTVLLRLLSSVPILSGLANSMLPKLEAALLTGGIADMEAVANNQVTAAVIRARVAGALAAIEARVKEGGTITVMAHSGGGPVAWRLLSDPDIHARQVTKRFRYRLITAGSALNWAKRGFGSIATPLDGALVNHQEEDVDRRTFWLNCYGTWDPVPHGPIQPDDFAGYEAWPESPSDRREAPPNRAMRNLGAPVPSEHDEYWRNQQEFVPSLLRAIDNEITWAARDAGPDQHLWANCRLALLSGLVRTRLTLVALPLAAFAALVRDRPFFSCGSDRGIFNAPYTDLISRGLKALVDATNLSADAKSALSLCGHPLLADIIVIAMFTLLVYALLDVYTNFLWQSLGRRTPTMRPAASPPPLIAIPWMPGLLLWAPTLLILPVVLFPFDVGRGLFWSVVALNTIMTSLEVLWFNTCLRAFQDDDLRGACAAPIGRHRKDSYKGTPASHGWL